jgi:hypothetical protein
VRRENEKLVAANIKTARGIIRELKAETNPKNDRQLEGEDIKRLEKAETFLATGRREADGEIDYAYDLVKDNISLSLLVHTLRKSTLIGQVDEANPMMAFVQQNKFERDWNMDDARGPRESTLLRP